jgi:uncharacterized protein HemX
MDNKPTTPNSGDQPGTAPVMDVKSPNNLNDVSMSDEGSAGSPKSPEVVPAGGMPTNPLGSVSPDQPKDGQQAASHPVPTKKSGKKVKVLLILLIALALAAAAGYLYMNKKDTTTSTTTKTTTATPTTATQDTQDAVNAVDDTVTASDNAGDTTANDLTDTTLGL